MKKSDPKSPPVNIPAKPGPKSKLVHSEHLLSQIRTCGRIQATVEETAAVLQVSLRTLQNFFTMYPDAKEAHEDGKLEGCVSLRRKQFALAEKNAGMAIFLGKNYLGQRDVQQIETGKPGDFADMTDDEVRADALRQARELAELDPAFAAELRAKRATKH